jgi:hypothetical protein
MTQSMSQIRTPRAMAVAISPRIIAGTNDGEEAMRILDSLRNKPQQRSGLPTPVTGRAPLEDHVPLSERKSLATTSPRLLINRKVRDSLSNLEESLDLDQLRTSISANMRDEDEQY